MTALMKNNIKDKEAFKLQLNVFALHNVTKIESMGFRNKITT